jgi:hypothetical protein
MVRDFVRHHCGPVSVRYGRLGNGLQWRDTCDTMTARGHWNWTSFQNEMISCFRTNLE